MLGGQLRILAGHDALEEQLDGDSIAQTFHEVPIHGSGEEGRDLRKVEAVKHRLSSYVFGEAPGGCTRTSASKSREGSLMAIGTFPCVCLPGAEKRFEV